MAATEATNASRDEAIKLAKNEGEALASVGADMPDDTTHACNRILLATIALNRLLPNSLPTTTRANTRAADHMTLQHAKRVCCCGGFQLRRERFDMMNHNEPNSGCVLKQEA